MIILYYVIVFLDALIACAVLRRWLSVELMTGETGVELLIQHTDREYGRVAVD